MISGEVQWFLIKFWPTSPVAYIVKAYWMCCSRSAHIKVFAKMTLSPQHGQSTSASPSSPQTHEEFYSKVKFAKGHTKCYKCHFLEESSLRVAKNKILKDLRMCFSHTPLNSHSSKLHLFSSLFNLCWSLASSSFSSSFSRYICHQSTTHPLRCCYWMNYLQ